MDRLIFKTQTKEMCGTFASETDLLKNTTLCCQRHSSRENQTSCKRGGLTVCNRRGQYEETRERPAVPHRAPTGVPLTITFQPSIVSPVVNSH